MKKFTAAFIFLLVSLQIHAQRFEVDTMVMTGKTDERINMVFLSDGYQQNELDKFITDVQWMMDALFAKQPYSRYRNYFNCFAIKVPSSVSGAANDPDSLINNYFGSTFNYADIWRLVVPTRSDRIHRVLSENFPEYDQAFMIVNDSRYGGSGGWIATSTVNSQGPEICIHELGHSFGGLSDEYWAGQVYARENSNMTQTSDTATVKWKRWLGYNATGIYPHAEAPSWYRPHENCEMRFLSREFCSVCKEEIVGKILDLTNPVISYQPENGSPGIVSDTIFKVSLLAPKPNTLKTWWELNRMEISTQTDSIRLSSDLLIPGHNSLTCFILDTTQLIRKSTHPTVHLDKVTWNINYQPSGIDYEVVASRSTVSVYPNPASETINLTFSNSQPSTSVTLARLYDASGKPVTRSYSIQPEGLTFNYSIPLANKRLPTGLYYLLVQSPDGLIRLPVIISK